MIIYSKKVIRFINEINLLIENVLSKEVGLKVRGDRFYNRCETISYPIKVVIYNDKKMLGYFDSDFYELGFHECLMYSSREQLHDLIRHELAHYIMFINYGSTIHQPHSPEFRQLCQRMGWGEKVYQATTCLEEGHDIFGVEENNVLRKVKKLMALTTSSNKNEAEQAMIKSQQLLLKHNIESKDIDNEDDERICIKRILKEKKENGKMRAISAILKTFFVSSIFHRTKEFTHLEILGSAVNIEIAEHVANVLNYELDKLWKQAQKQANLKGAVAKKSFFLGLAQGYCDKIQAFTRDHNSDVKNALMVIEKKLTDGREMIYQRLYSRKSHASYCAESSMLGKQMGRQLNINPAINKSQKSEELIAYSG